MDSDKKPKKCDDRYLIVEENYKGHFIIFDKHLNFYCWGRLYHKDLAELKIKIRDRPDLKAKEEYLKRCKSDDK